MIADRLQPTFHDYGFYFDGGLELPAGVAKAEIAVIAAHGSIVPEGRYFQLISDDSGLRVPASDLARKLRNTGVVILFVCSGGRADKHPASNTTVGLAKQLLDRGCSAVIASPWPLDARVTYHWLPEFLRCWTLGQPVIDASFSANEAVAAALGDDPARCLAMSVYGDGLRMKVASSDASGLATSRTRITVMGCASATRMVLCLLRLTSMGDPPTPDGGSATSS